MKAWLCVIALVICACAEPTATERTTTVEGVQLFSGCVYQGQDDHGRDVYRYNDNQGNRVTIHVYFAGAGWHVAEATVAYLDHGHMSYDTYHADFGYSYNNPVGYTVTHSLEMIKHLPDGLHVPPVNNDQMYDHTSWSNDGAHVGWVETKALEALQSCGL